MSTDARTAAFAFMKLFPPPVQRQHLGEYKTEIDPEVILRHISFSEKLFPHNAIMLCPVSHPDLKYISENAEYILGHKYQGMTDLELSDFFALIHEEDLPSLKQCYEFMANCKDYDPEEYRFVAHFRFKKQDGEYVYIKQENIAAKTENNCYLYLMLLSSVDEKFHQVKLDMLKKMRGTFPKIYTYNPKQTNVITPRQNDIANFIMKGFSNQEIADKLRVSIFTVKNHKRMLFKKVNVKNSMELANYVREMNA